MVASFIRVFCNPVFPFLLHVILMSSCYFIIHKIRQAIRIMTTIMTTLVVKIIFKLWIRKQILDQDDSWTIIYFLK